MQNGELDLIDEFTYKLYDVLSSWYNPFERMETRHKYINSIADDFSDFIFGDESDQQHILEKQEMLARQERQKIPKSLSKLEIVDMHYVFNPEQNNTVMLALM